MALVMMAEVDMERYCVFGLTSNHLPVARLAERMGPRVTDVRDYPLASLLRCATSVGSSIWGPGIARVVGRIEIAEPKPSLRIDFAFSLMADNSDVYRAIRDTLLPEEA